MCGEHYINSIIQIRCDSSNSIIVARNVGNLGKCSNIRFKLMPVVWCCCRYFVTQRCNRIGGSIRNGRYTEHRVKRKKCSLRTQHRSTRVKYKYSNLQTYKNTTNALVVILFFITKVAKVCAFLPVSLRYYSFLSLWFFLSNILLLTLSPSLFWLLFASFFLSFYRFCLFIFTTTIDIPTLSLSSKCCTVQMKKIKIKC